MGQANPDAPDPYPYVPVGSQTPETTDDDTPTTYIPDTTQGQQGDDDAAYLPNPVVDPQNTHFRNTLYVSNDVGAFNTVLINIASAGHGFPDSCVGDDTDTNDVDESGFGTPRMTATVKNNRSGGNIEIQLVEAGCRDRRLSGPGRGRERRRWRLLPGVLQGR